MAQVRNERLDHFCEAIGEDLVAINEATLSKAGNMSGALEEMKRTRQTIYKHAGVRLTLVPGSDKVNVRLVKEQGDQAVPELEQEPSAEQEDLGAADEIAAEVEEAVEDELENIVQH